MGNILCRFVSATSEGTRTRQAEVVVAVVVGSPLLDLFCRQLPVGSRLKAAVAQVPRCVICYVAKAHADGVEGLPSGTAHTPLCLPMYPSIFMRITHICVTDSSARYAARSRVPVPVPLPYRGTSDRNIKLFLFLFFYPIL